MAKGTARSPRHPVTGSQRQSERGAIVIMVAVALLGLLAFSAFTIDHGVLLVSRRQAQNSADAGALAGARFLAFDGATDWVGAQLVAEAFAEANGVWTEPPDVTPADITFPPCPPGAPGIPDTCIRVDVFRNQRPNGNPLPVFFASLVGMPNQGVRATATAQIVSADAARCVKPFAIPDKWTEWNPVVSEWTEDDTFERYISNGPNAGQLLNPADDYLAPWNAADGIGSGFTPEADGGRRLRLKVGNPQEALAPGLFLPVVINPVEGPGGNNYRENIAACDLTEWEPGDLLTVEPGNMVGPTVQGIQALYDLDPDAWWDDSDGPTAFGDLGSVVGGCMEYGTCPDGLSPRIAALPVFDPDAYDLGRASGRVDVVITRILGFFIDGIDNNGDVWGYLMNYPTLASGTLDNEASFLRTVILVR